MRSAQADYPYFVLTSGRRKTMKLAINDPVKPKSRLPEPVVLDNTQRVEVDRAAKRNTVLFDIRGVLSRIKLDVHADGYR